MPAYPTRTATKKATIQVDFTSGTVLTAPIDSYTYYNGDGGLTIGYPIFVQGVNTTPTPDQYVLRAGMAGEIINIAHTTLNDYSYNPHDVIKGLGDKLIVDISDAPTMVKYFVTDMPTASGDPGPASTTYSVDVTAWHNLAYSLADQGRILPSVGHGGNNFAAGRLYFGGDDPDADYHFALLGNTGGQGLRSAFKTPGLAYAARADYVAQIAGETKNYTFMSVYDGTGHNFLTEWVPDGAFANYNIALSDSTDNAMWQQLVYSYSGDNSIIANSTNWIFTFNPTFPVTTAKAFVFNADMTEYTVYEITSNATMAVGTFFIDDNGDLWLTGYEDTNGDMVTQFYAPASGPQATGNLTEALDTTTITSKLKIKSNSGLTEMFDTMTSVTALSAPVTPPVLGNRGTSPHQIILRRGPAFDLPGKPIKLFPRQWSEPLDEGELAFASDQGRMFIGTDPAKGLKQSNRLQFPYQNNEIIGENSVDAFADLHGERMREGDERDYYSAPMYPTSIPAQAQEPERFVVEQMPGYFSYGVEANDPIVTGSGTPPQRIVSASHTMLVDSGTGAGASTGWVKVLTCPVEGEPAYWGLGISAPNSTLDTTCGAINHPLTGGYPYPVDWTQSATKYIQEIVNTGSTGQLKYIWENPAYPIAPQGVEADTPERILRIMDFSRNRMVTSSYSYNSDTLSRVHAVELRDSAGSLQSSFGVADVGDTDPKAIFTPVVYTQNGKLAGIVNTLGMQGLGIYDESGNPVSIPLVVYGTYDSGTNTTKLTDTVSISGNVTVNLGPITHAGTTYYCFGNRDISVGTVGDFVIVSCGTHSGEGSDPSSYLVFTTTGSYVGKIAIPSGYLGSTPPRWFKAGNRAIAEVHPTIDPTATHFTIFTPDGLGGVSVETIAMDSIANSSLLNYGTPKIDYYAYNPTDDSLIFFSSVHSASDQGTYYVAVKYSLTLRDTVWVSEISSLILDASIPPISNSVWRSPPNANNHFMDRLSGNSFKWISGIGFHQIDLSTGVIKSAAWGETNITAPANSSFAVSRFHYDEVQDEIVYAVSGGTIDRYTFTNNSIEATGDYSIVYQGPNYILGGDELSSKFGELTSPSGTRNYIVNISGNRWVGVYRAETLEYVAGWDGNGTTTLGGTIVSCQHGIALIPITNGSLLKVTASDLGGIGFTVVPLITGTGGRFGMDGMYFHDTSDNSLVVIGGPSNLTTSRSFKWSIESSTIIWSQSYSGPSSETGDGGLPVVPSCSSQMINGGFFGFMNPDGAVSLINLSNGARVYKGQIEAPWGFSQWSWESETNTLLYVNSQQDFSTSSSTPSIDDQLEDYNGEEPYLGSGIDRHVDIIKLRFKRTLQGVWSTEVTRSPTTSDEEKFAPDMRMWVNYKDRFAYVVSNNYLKCYDIDTLDLVATSQSGVGVSFLKVWGSVPTGKLYVQYGSHNGVSGSVYGDDTVYEARLHSYMNYTPVSAFDFFGRHLPQGQPWRTVNIDANPLTPYIVKDVASVDMFIDYVVNDSNGMRVRHGRQQVQFYYNPLAIPGEVGTDDIVPMVDEADIIRAHETDPEFNPEYDANDALAQLGFRFLLVDENVTSPRLVYQYRNWTGNIYTVQWKVSRINFIVPTAGPGGNIAAPVAIEMFAEGSFFEPEAMYEDHQYFIKLGGYVGSTNDYIWSPIDEKYGYVDYKAIAVDSERSVYIAGRNWESDPNFIVVKYNSEGHFEWQRNIGQTLTGGEYCSAYEIAVDEDNNIYVVGESRERIANPIVDAYTQYSAVIVKYNKDGEELWSQIFDGAAASEIVWFKSVGYRDGYLYAVGGSRDESTTLKRNRALVVRINPFTGAIMWQRIVHHSSNYSYAYDVEIDGSGNVILLADTYSRDYGLMKFDPSGNTMWTNGVTGSESHYGDDIKSAMDSSGNVYVTKTAWNGYGIRVMCHNGADGSLVWEKKIAPQANTYDLQTPSIVIYDDTIYITAMFDTWMNFFVVVYALDLNGNLLWTRMVDDCSDAYSGNYYGANYLFVDDSWLYLLGNKWASMPDHREDYTAVVKLPRLTTPGQTYYYENRLSYFTPTSDWLLTSSITNGTIYSIEDNLQWYDILTTPTLAPSTVFSLVTQNYDKDSNSIPSTISLAVSLPAPPENADNYYSLRLSEGYTINYDMGNAAVVVDDDGNMYASGFISGPGTTYDGTQVVKYSPTGVILWKKIIRDTTFFDGSVIHLAVNSTHLYVISADNGYLSVAQIAVSDGALVRMKAASGISAATVKGTALSGNLLVIGGEFQATQFEASAFIAGIDIVSGDTLWFRYFGTASRDTINGVDINSSGEIIIGGYIGGSTVKPFSAKLTSNASSFIWANSLSPNTPGTEDIWNQGSAIDPDGNTYNVSQYTTTSPNSGVAIAKMDPSGNVLWNRLWYYTPDNFSSWYFCGGEVAFRDGKLFINGVINQEDGDGEYVSAFDGETGDLVWAKGMSYGGGNITASFIKGTITTAPNAVIVGAYHYGDGGGAMIYRLPLDGEFGPQQELFVFTPEIQEVNWSPEITSLIGEGFGITTVTKTMGTITGMTYIDMPTDITLIKRDFF